MIIVELGAAATKQQVVGPAIKELGQRIEKNPNLKGATLPWGKHQPVSEAFGQGLQTAGGKMEEGKL
jgi:hypothetical protein